MNAKRLMMMGMIAVLSVLFVGHHWTPTRLRSVILQGSDVDALKRLVERYGGEVTHELSVINGIAANVSDRNLEAFRQMNNVEVHDNRLLKTATQEAAGAVCPVELPKMKMHGSHIHAEMLNAGDASLDLVSVTLLWPPTAGALEKAKAGGKKVLAEPVAAPSITIDVTELELKDRELKADKKFKLDFEFEDDLVAGDYFVKADFSNGCAATFDMDQGEEEEEGRGDRSHSDKKSKRSHFPTLVGANALHDEGIHGSGVTIATIDTGLWAKGSGGKFVVRGRFGEERLLAQYDAIKDEEKKSDKSMDENGHGTHVTSIMASSRKKWGFYNGVAPNADLVSVRAFDKYGHGSYADVIRGLSWVVDNQSAFNIRVLNLSFSAEPRSHYWDDPLNQAVMKAWEAGIVVVASAGNVGPEPMTIGVPGNVPYVITVGAMTDSFTPADASDDSLATFSSAGPTYEGFVKPEVLAPGGHLRGLMDKGDRLAKDHPEFHDADSYFLMSGTSQAAAVVSGSVALMLHREPWLTPDDVKCRLMTTARPATDANGQLAYSVFQQGAGLIDAYGASFSTATGCGNPGLNVSSDLTGAEHYAGLARRDEHGNFYLEGYEDHVWSGSFLWNNSKLWGNSFLWNNSMLWNNSFLWNNSMLWNNSEFSQDSFLWNNSVGVNVWVKQE